MKKKKTIISIVFLTIGISLLFIYLLTPFQNFRYYSSVNDALIKIDDNYKKDKIYEIAETDDCVFVLAIDRDGLICFRFNKTEQGYKFDLWPSIYTPMIPTTNGAIIIYEQNQCDHKLVAVTQFYLEESQDALFVSNGIGEKGSRAVFETNYRYEDNTYIVVDWFLIEKNTKGFEVLLGDHKYDIA